MVSVTNRKALLDCIAWSEGTSTIATSDNGYNVLVGCTNDNPLLFSSYADHPRIYNAKFNSTAAGRYQLLARFFDFYKSQLGLPDFSPNSQDMIALQQIRESGGLIYIDSGNFVGCINSIAHIWASLPGAGYGQHEHDIVQLRSRYEDFGGSVS